MRPLPPTEAVPAVDPVEEASLRELAQWLDGCAVTDEAFARHKLYTWTRAARIEELRHDTILLNRGRLPGEMSRFDVAITDDEHPIAAHLRGRRRARRYAWVTPWATRMGWADHDYGDRLVEITLRPEAWLARFAPDEEARWRVVDGEGRAVSDEDARAHPSRIAAVYHLADGPHAYREVIVVDERWVERWAFATASVRARLRLDARRLRALAARWRADPPVEPDDLSRWLRDGWTSPVSPDLLARYRACVALGSPGYSPTPGHVEAMADALDATPFDAPVEHEVRRHRWFNVVLGSQTFCDETMGCWEDRHRPGTLRLRAR